MPRINSFTSLEQSKKLAEILPLETADMEYLAIKENGELIGGGLPFVKDDSEVEDSAYSNTYDRIVCWSLAALMNILDRGALFKTPQGWTFQSYKDFKAITSNYYDNPADACVEIIEKLYDLNLL